MMTLTKMNVSNILGLCFAVLLASLTATTASDTKCSSTETNEDYFGNISTTINRLTCQNWTDQEQDSRYVGYEANYCRNPDKKPHGAWCYTVDPNTIWEHCTIPKCNHETVEETPEVLREMVTLDNVEINKEVVRGRDWSGGFEDRDGVGIIVVNHRDGWVAVRWIKSYRTTTYDYRIGADDMFQLYYAAAGEGCNEANPCPVRGEVGEWSIWTAYTKTCGIATRKRHRKCVLNDPTRICEERRDERQIHHRGNCPPVWKTTSQGYSCYDDYKCESSNGIMASGFGCYTTSRWSGFGNWQNCCNENSPCTNGQCQSGNNAISCERYGCSGTCHKDADCINGACKCRSGFQGNGHECISFVQSPVAINQCEFGATSEWDYETDNLYKAEKAFLTYSYWHPDRLTRLPQTVYVKLQTEHRVISFNLVAGKTDSRLLSEYYKDWFPRNFTFFGSNDNDCLAEDKWEYQKEFSNVDYDGNTFTAELDNPTSFRCYGIKVNEVRGQATTEYTAIKKINLFQLPAQHPICRCSSANDQNVDVQASTLNERPNSMWPRNCGITIGRRKRIVNGDISRVTDHPWQVQIERRELGLWKHHCGGTLIKDNVVLSAAHCFNSHEVDDNFRVVTGQQHVLSASDNHSIHEIQTIHRHTGYDDTYRDDIALIILKNPLQFSSKARPACLPNPLNSKYNEDTVGQKLVVSGYGTTELSGGYSTQLRNATVAVILTSKCRDEFRSDPRNRNYANYVNAHTNLCAKDDKARSHGEAAADCVGDSGGPVMANINGTNVLVGIISWGQGCRDSTNHFPSVFTRISCYLSWIHEQLNLDFECADINECASHPCQHGTCKDRNNDYVCECNPGYTGIHCEFDIDECASSPCGSNGDCKDLLNDYECRCSLGYSGENCEININECDSKPCFNGATCTDGINQYTCKCAIGFTGNHCENNINECASNPCRNGYECIDGINSYTCHCTPRDHGTQCDINIDHCANNPCVNGDCENLVDKYICNCNAGFTGANCQIRSLRCRRPDHINIPSSIINQTCHPSHCSQSTEGQTCHCKAVIGDYELNNENNVRAVIVKKMCWDYDDGTRNYEDCARANDAASPDCLFADKIEICYEDDIDAAQAMCRHFNKGDASFAPARGVRWLGSMENSRQRRRLAKLKCREHPRNLNDCELEFLPRNRGCHQMVAKCKLSPCWEAKYIIKAGNVYGQACRLEPMNGSSCSQRCFNCPPTWTGDPRDGANCFRLIRGSMTWE